MIGIVIGFVVLVLVLCVAMIGAVIRAVFGLLAALVRIVAMAVAAGAIATGVGLAFAAAGADTGPAMLMGLIAFPFVVWLMGKRSKPRAVAVPVSYSGPAESAPDAALGAAWEQLAAMVPPAQNAALFDARAACVDLLAVADRTLMDMDIVACAVFIRRNLPELASRNALLWAQADAAERAVLVDGILEDAARFGAYALREAARETQRSRRTHDDGLAALRHHIAARTGG